MTKKNEKNTEKDPSLKEELEKCREECSDWKEKFIRSSADLENFQKRIVKERAVWMENAQSDVFSNLLSIVDDFDRALMHTPTEASADAKAMRQGFEMIYSAFYKLLDKYGIKEITEISTFDPEQHEAMVQIESPDHESGSIVEIMQKGFTYNDKVLRPAKVSVAK